MKINGRKLAIIMVISVAVFVAVLFLRGVTSAATGQDVIRLTSDAAFVAGLVMLIIGGLIWTTDQGVADGLTYGFSRFFKRRGANYDERRESFSEYRERKHSKKVRVVEFLISGGFFLAISLILLAMYSSMG